jgi:transketolase C-terminal domain/subunit
MRDSFIKLITKNINRKKNIYFITADLGFSVLEKLKEKLKYRFINVGICENHMSLFATGLSEKKNNVYIYSIATFLTLRCFEIFRNYFNKEERAIKIISVGSNFSYGEMGPTHHVNEDVGLISNLENFYNCNPGNTNELKYIYNLQNKFSNKPFYIRLNKSDFSKPGNYHLKIEKDFFFKSGKKINIITSGIAQKYFFKAIVDRYQYNIFNHISLPELNKINLKNVVKRIINTNSIILIDFLDTVKSVHELKYLIKNKNPHKKIKTFSVYKLNNLKVGNQDYLFEQNGFTINKIRKCLDLLVFNKS